MADSIVKPSDTRTFGALKRLYVIPGLFMSFFSGLALLIVLRKPDQWPVLAVAASAWLLLILLVAYFRLEFSTEGFYYRNVNASCWIFFQDLERAYFKVESAQAAAFFVRDKLGREVRLNIRCYPVEAGALLFQSLKNHGIAIEVPARHGPSIRMFQAIRARQQGLLQSPEEGARPT